MTYSAAVAFVLSCSVSRRGGLRPTARSFAQCSQMDWPPSDNGFAPQYWHFLKVAGSSPNACSL